MGIDKEAFNKAFDLADIQIENTLKNYNAEPINEQKGNFGAAVKAVGAIPSKDRAKMEDYFNYYKRLTPEGWHVELKNMSIVITMSKYVEGPDPGSYNSKHDYTAQQDELPEEKSKVNEELEDVNYTKHIASIVNYMENTMEMDINPLPDISIEDNEENSNELFGKTAYYNPDDKKIVVYKTNRHPKDVLRSFCHEMIHHEQNLKGKIKNIKTSDTNEDSNIEDLEKEAHSRGSMTFRYWEDYYKNQNSDG